MWNVIGFYRFTPISPDRLPGWKEELERFAAAKSLVGLIILAEEGLNATVAGSHVAIEEFKTYIKAALASPDILFKESRAESAPFQKFVVKIRTEIVTTGQPPIEVSENESALSPTEWHALLESGEPVTIIDTRNYYETRIGTFKNAVDPKIDNFVQLFERVDELNVPRDRKILMYCTGGIRCEKGLPLLKRRGYQNVFQLEGGILNYLEQYPNGYFEGECFVFDQRVAVDGNLQPSARYRLCPLCGEPASEHVACDTCGVLERLCPTCIRAQRNYCSTRCENQKRSESSTHP